MLDSIRRTFTGHDHPPPQRLSGDSAASLQRSGHLARYRHGRDSRSQLPSCGRCRRQWRGLRICQQTQYHIRGEKFLSNLKLSVKHSVACKSQMFMSCNVQGHSPFCPSSGSKHTVHQNVCYQNEGWVGLDFSTSV